MSSSTSPVYLGLDVHKNTISAAILRPGEDVADAGNVHLRTQFVESAWAYKSRPAVGAQLRRR